MQALEVLTGRAGQRSRLDGPAGEDAVMLHGWQYIRLEIRGCCEHDGSKQNLHLVAAFDGWCGLAKEDGSAEHKDRAADKAHKVQHTQRATDDKAGFMLRRQQMEGHRGEHEGEEDEPADPDDHRQQAQDANRSLHGL